MTSRSKGRLHPESEAIVIRIAITVEAYDAIAATLPVGSVAYEPRSSGSAIAVSIE